MSGFDGESGFTDLEGDLVRRRPAPRDEFVAVLARSVGARPRQSRTAQLGVAVAIAGTMILGFGVGGAGFALSADSTPKKSTGVHLDQSAVIHRPNSSSHAQYGPVPVPPYPPTTTPTTPSPPPPPPPPASTTTPNPPAPPPTTTGGTSGGSAGQPAGSPPTSTTGVAGAGHGQSTGLPFTGVSLLFPVLFGLLLIGVGLVLRRRGRSTEK